MTRTRWVRLPLRPMPSAAAAALGQYTPRFLHAQAAATRQAMTARGRDCTLVVLDRLEDVTDALEALQGLLRARLALHARGRAA
jgi:hypothetical protein